MVETMQKVLESEKTKRKGGKAKKQLTMKNKTISDDQHSNLNKISLLVYQVINIRHKLCQSHLSLNLLSDNIRKRGPDETESLEESEQKEQLYMRIQQYDNQLKSVLDLLAPDEIVREKYLEPVYQAQATVEFPADYKISHVMNKELPEDCIKYAIKNTILKETKSKKQQPMKKIDEFLLRRQTTM